MKGIMIMMKIPLSKRKVFFLAFICSLFTEVQCKGVNGGINCAACTIAVGLIEQLAIVKNVAIDKVLQKSCDYLPKGVYNKACTMLIEKFGPVTIQLLYMELTPDEVCHGLGFCYTEPQWQQCHLFPPPIKRPWFEKTAYAYRDLIKKHENKNVTNILPKICDLPGVNVICNIFNRTFGEFRAGIDIDSDGFSETVEQLRGYAWRGRDCDDFHSDIYPGASLIDSDVVYDANCNGIYGREPVTGKPYEELLCGKTPGRGVVMIGDSVSAHFHLPAQWLKVNEITKEVLETLPYIVENEFDWPHMSFSTGFKNVTWTVVEGPVDSLYLRFRERNLCNHRDYQNLAVNGGDSFNTLQYVKALQRNQSSDDPVMAFFALVGNDVCNHYPDSEKHMTTPKEMEENYIKILEYLDTKFPPGSHVMMTGMADGRILYNSLENRLHPFGELMSDIKYPQFYEFLKCLQITPCAGWMTTNGTLRNITSQRAEQLTVAIQKVVKEQKFKNFKTSFIENPLTTVIKEWVQTHGKGTVYQLIEPIDGFHPNQYAEASIAKLVWKTLEEHHPESLGEINPFNAKIKSIFGDQGGH